MTNGESDTPTHTHKCTRPPVSRDYLCLIQKDLYDTIKLAEESYDPGVKLAGIAILAKYEKLVDVIHDIEDAGLEDKK